MDVLNILIHAKISSGEVREPHDKRVKFRCKVIQIVSKNKVGKRWASLETTPTHLVRVNYHSRHLMRNGPWLNTVTLIFQEIHQIPGLLRRKNLSWSPR